MAILRLVSDNPQTVAKDEADEARGWIRRMNWSHVLFALLMYIILVHVANLDNTDTMRFQEVVEEFIC